MARADLDYITLSDFTPGVYSKYGAVGQLGKDGAAQITDGRGRYTHGCYGDPDGGLRPLPGVVKTFSTDFVENAYNDDVVSVYTFSPITGTKVAVVDFVAVGDMRATTNPSASEGAGLEGSYTDASDTHPDILYVLTSHFTDNITGATGVYGLGGLWAGHSAHPGRAYDSNGARVGQLKSWEVCRMSNGSASLSAVETQLQARINAVRWGNTDATYGWAAYDTAIGGTTFDRAALTQEYAKTDSDAFHAGSIAVGRSIDAVTVASGDTGSTISLETLDYPGRLCIVACLMTGVGACDADDRLVGYGNIFTAHGLPQMDVGIVYGVSGRQSMQVSFPNRNASLGTGKLLDDWSNGAVPWLVATHLDRFVGLVRTLAFGGYGPYTSSFFGVPTPNGPDSDGLTATQGPFMFVGSQEVFAFSESNAAVVFDTAETPPTNNYNIWLRESTYRPRFKPIGHNDPSNMGVMASLNNDLLFVRHSGGGYVMRGSPEDPTIISLPGIHSTGGVASIPAITPLGVVYGTAEGVVAWAGDTESTYVSPQLDGWFWGTGDDNEVSINSSRRRKQALSGRFAYNYPFVYAPNDWVMDIRTGAWFRLVDPATDTNPYKHMFFDTNAQGKVYAARGCYDANNLDVVDLFDPRTRTSSYQWVSQPIYRSINRDMDVQEVVVVGQGTGTVTVTLLGIDDTEDAQTFQFDDDERPQRKVQNYKVRASDIIVIIEATGASGGEAPTVHAVNVGVPKEKQVGIPREA